MKKRGDEKYIISNSLAHNIIRNIIMAKSVEKNMNIDFLKDEVKRDVFKELVQDIILKTYDDTDLDNLDKYSYSDMTFVGKDSNNPINIMMKDIDEGLNDTFNQEDLFASVDDKVFSDIYDFTFTELYEESKSLFDELNDKYGAAKVSSQPGD